MIERLNENVNEKWKRETKIDKKRPIEIRMSVIEFGMTDDYVDNMIGGYDMLS